MRVAIVGSRHFGSEALWERAYATLCENIPANATEIVSGGAIGVDTLAERYAKENHLRLKVFPPDYDLFGKRAPILRNDEIVAYSQYVIAIWDGSSRGTAYTISACLEKGVPVKAFIL